MKLRVLEVFGRHIDLPTDDERATPVHVAGCVGENR
jgi:hypothetical protein